jgi:hypothetical protein
VLRWRLLLQHIFSNTGTDAVANNLANVFTDHLTNSIADGNM